MLAGEPNTSRSVSASSQPETSAPLAPIARFQPTAPSCFETSSTTRSSVSSDASAPPTSRGTQSRKRSASTSASTSGAGSRRCSSIASRWAAIKRPEGARGEEAAIGFDE